MREMPERGQIVTWTDNVGNEGVGMVVKLDKLTGSALVSPYDTPPGDTVWIDRALLNPS